MRYKHLTFEQRYHIELGKRRPLTSEVIARQIGVHPSTVSREYRLGQDPDGYYCAARADERAKARHARSAGNHPTKPAVLWDLVGGWIAQGHSPEQAAGRLNWVGVELRVSVPAIYAYVRRNERICGDLHTQLRRAHKKALWRSSTGGMPRNRPSIRHRPKHIQERLQAGHWEADTMRGKISEPRCVLTAVERKSRYTCLGVLTQPTADLTATLLSKTLAPFKVRSITFDNGTEFARYASACNALAAKPYFAEPGRPEQRGTCENTIGLVRQYLPKYTSLQRLTEAKLKSIEDRLNHRPRKCLGYLTPHEVLFGLKPIPIALRT